MKNNQPSYIQWRTIIKYVDLETGEELSKIIAKKNYLTIKINRNYVRDKYKGTGTIISTHECRRNPQTALFE